MSNFKRFSLLFLAFVLLLTLSSCYHSRGFYGNYHQRNYHYKSYDDNHGRDYHGYDRHNNYRRNNYRR